MKCSTMLKKERSALQDMIVNFRTTDKDITTVQYRGKQCRKVQDSAEQIRAVQYITEDSGRTEKFITVQYSIEHIRTDQ